MELFIWLPLCINPCTCNLCSREPAYVYLHAWAAEESTFKVEDHVNIIDISSKIRVLAAASANQTFLVGTSCSRGSSNPSHGRDCRWICICPTCKRPCSMHALLNHLLDVGELFTQRQPTNVKLTKVLCMPMNLWRIGSQVPAINLAAPWGARSSFLSTGKLNCSTAANAIKQSRQAALPPIA